MFRFQEIKNNPRLQFYLLGSMEVRRLIREWFRKNGFLEIETPALVHATGQEPYLDPFTLTVKNESGQAEPAFLITSPEYAHKKLLAAGFPKIFELARCFRNGEPQSRLHQPEFTLLEWYRANADYQEIMGDVEQLVNFVFLNLQTKYPRPMTIDFTPPWERLSVSDAFRQYAELDLETVKDETTFFKIFLTQIESRLGQKKPTILYDYPASMAALAKIKKNDRRYAERFEVYLKGQEIANAFSELTDAAEQKNRFQREQEERKKTNRPIYPLDQEFLASLTEMPGAGGIALGIDRLSMILLDAPSLHEVIFFPYYGHHF